MNGLAQVRHLFVNDVRRLRWMLVGYVAVVVIAVISAISLPIAPMGWFRVSPLLVSLTGFILVASAVQADSPWRPDAFWMSRPIQPFAVLGAKLVMAVLVVAIPVAGLMWTLIHLGIPSGEYLPMLGRASVTFSRWLLLGMAIAAVTRDLRSFANTAVVVVVLGLVALAMFYGRLGSGPGQRTTGASIHAVVEYLAPLALLVFVYWRRDSVTLARILGATTLAGLYLFEPFTLAPDRSAAPSATGEASGDALHLSVAFARLTATRIDFQVTGAAQPNASRLVLTPDSLLVHARDGSTIAVRSPQQIIVVNLPRTAPDSLPWRDIVTDGLSSMPLTVGQAQALASGVASLELLGRVEVYAVQAARIVPFTSGQRITVNGTRLQLDSVQHDAYGASVSVTSVALQQDGADESALLRRVRMQRVAWTLPTYQLVDDSTRYAIRLAIPSSGSSDVSLVLPGSNLTRQWSHIQTPLDYTATDAAGQVRRLHFLYLEWDYVGSARVRARSPVE